MSIRRTEEQKTDLITGLIVSIWIVLSVLFGGYILMQTWQEVSRKESDYHALGWKSVQAEIVELGNINGDFKPVSQGATLQYRYDSEEPIRTQQQIGLGYNTSNKVSLFANKNGEVVVKNAPNGSRVSYDPTIKSFDGDYFSSVVAGIFAGILAAIGLVVGAVVLVLIFAGIVYLFESIFKSEKKAQTAS